MLSGHLFPLLLDAVQVGSKRRAEDSLGLGILDVQRSTSGRTSTFTARPFRSYKHMHGEAILDADLGLVCFRVFGQALDRASGIQRRGGASVQRLGRRPRLCCYAFSHVQPRERANTANMHIIRSN